MSRTSHSKLVRAFSASQRIPAPRPRCVSGDQSQAVRLAKRGGLQADSEIPKAVVAVLPVSAERHSGGEFVGRDPSPVIDEHETRYGPGFPDETRENRASAASMELSTRSATAVSNS